MYINSACKTIILHGCIKLGLKGINNLHRDDKVTLHSLTLKW